ncbi:MAG: isoaspartyl peptidase/L-asparaginase [Verrucomicrobia bacterium]|nr:isoaspartyl peptidase/L-asparaginase [Verrucomicrobiota bacterium]
MLSFFIFVAAAAASVVALAQEQDVVLVIHGGAASREDALITPEWEQRARAGLKRAAEEGFAVYRRGGSSLDIIEASIRSMEDDPVFNAGKGAVYTLQGKNELDASIMEGRGLKAGAVAGVTHVKNPISAARAVMDKTKHVLLVSEGANTFARENGLEMVDPSYFRTEERWRELQEHLAKQKPRGNVDPPRSTHWSTVGAVARDAKGDLAAGTSTGGMAYKRYGRVGDSPMIGAGTYADNAAAGISATGHGEFFIRYAVTHDIVALMKYRNLSVQAAADEVIQGKLKPAGGMGGVICLDKNGRVASSFNTDGLFRAYVKRDGSITVKLFRE